MFVQISPSENDLGETMSSLNFASRARGVELGPAKKQIDTGELQKMKQMVSNRYFTFVNVDLLLFVLAGELAPSMYQTNAVKVFCLML